MHRDSRGPGPQNHAWPDREIAELAAAQAANVAHAQLRALGIAPSTITAALARGRLHRVHHGVHSLVPAEARPRLAAEHAALLACGPRAVLSHATAARLHGLTLPGPPGDVQVTIVGTHRSRGRPHLEVHTTASLQRDEWMRLGGLPVTTIARAVLDLAAELGERTTEHLVDQALRRTSRAKLAELVRRHRGRPGIPALRRALRPDRPSSETWSVAEERLLTLLTLAGVPAPEVNVAVGRYVPDLLWREWGVIAEFDSRAHHSGDHARVRDAARHNDLTAGGYVVLHITWSDLAHPERVLVWIVAALTRGGWTGAGR